MTLFITLSNFKSKYQNYCAVGLLIYNIVIAMPYFATMPWFEICNITTITIFSLMFRNFRPLIASTCILWYSITIDLLSSAIFHFPADIIAGIIWNSKTILISIAMGLFYEIYLQSINKNRLQGVENYA